MSSFSTEDRNKSSSNESRILHFFKLKPYDLEPVCESRMFLSESEVEGEVEEQGRVGNAYWCQCGECKHMAVWLLIQKACVVRTLMKFLQKFSAGQKCITKPSRFKIVCMEKPVLYASLSALNYLRGDSMETLDYSSYKFAGYKQYTFWVHNYLGKGVRKVIPSCAV